MTGYLECHWRLDEDCDIVLDNGMSPTLPQIIDRRDTLVKYFLAGQQFAQPWIENGPRFYQSSAN